MASPIQVLVVDDSAFMRKVLTGILEKDPDIRVVGTAGDGLTAVDKAVSLHPDVITLDVEMPHLDGLGALKQIMQVAPCPVIMVSSLTQQGAKATVEALASGAFDFVPKPAGAISLNLALVGDELICKVKAAAKLPRGGPWLSKTKVALGDGLGASARAPAVTHALRPGHTSTGLPWLTIVAASTGGPGMLHRFFRLLPGNLHSSLLVVQHMPAGFTAALAEHLDIAVQLQVKEAASGDHLMPGQALLAPGGKHLTLVGGHAVELNEEPPQHGVRPAADVTLASVSPGMARRTVVIILSGMGKDGATGAQTLHQHGALVWAQDEASSVVFGMPKAALETGVVSRMGTPEQLAAWLVELVGGG